MKAFFILLLLFSLNATADEQFIEDSGLQIKSGYGNTSKQYFSYDLEELGRSYKFKKNRCYQGKINKFKSSFKRLEKKGFTFTNTETYINDLPNGTGQIATFLVTFVKDTYEGNWIEDESSAPLKEGPRARPADYLVYRYVHFECELKDQTQIHSRGRKDGKNIQKNSGESPKESKSKMK
ncbi:MAG: hypothetical protein ACJAT2_000522 [Bacteriovoracaceae bacterium]|jgi:hypothetical protein